MADNIAIEKRLRRRDVAKLAGVHLGTVARWERKGLLPGIKVNSRLTLYRESVVLAFLDGENFPQHNKGKFPANR